MQLYHALGDALVTNEELIEKSATGTLASFEKAAREGRPDTFTFAATTAKASEHSPLTVVDGRRVPFEPIGLGRPLTVEIRRVYTGNLPRGLLDKTKDLLVATAHKASTQYKAAPRAVNHVKKDVARKAPIDLVAATELGSPIVLHSPGIVDGSISLTAELSFAEFPKEFFESAGNLLVQAGAIPIFATASGYLVGAGLIAKLIAKIGKLIFDDGADFRASKEIVLFRPGLPVTKEGYAVFLPEDFERPADEVRLDADGVLTLRGGGPYAGESPYVVVSFDGRERRDLEKFASTYASAEQLDRFYNLGENRVQPSDVLLEGLQLYNDMKFRKLAADARTRFDAAPPGSAEQKQARKEHAALLKNIAEALLRPEAIPGEQ